MAKIYYATATSKDGKIFIVENLSGLYPAAERQAKQECVKQGLSFQRLHLLGGKNETASTLTKFAKARKKNGQK